MSKFKKVAKVQQGGGSTIDPSEWKAWNEYVYDRIQEVTEDGDEPSQVCFISGICDTGMQEPREEYREYPWKDTEQQNKLLKLDGVAYRDGDKFYVKNRHNDTVVMTVDYPTIMIDYSKHPASDSEEEDLRPLRQLLSGDFKPKGATASLATPVNLTPSKDGFDPKSKIAQLCKATGVKKGKVPADFNIGELMGVPFMSEITAAWSEDGVWMNPKVGAITSKPKVIPVPEHNIEPFAVMMDGDNDEEDLKQLSRPVIERLKMAQGFDESPLKKELEKLGKLGASPSTDSGSDDKPKKSISKPSKVEQEPDEELGDDDENPFLLDGDDDE